MEQNSHVAPDDIKLDDLIITQHSVRDKSLISTLVHYVKQGQRFTSPPLIVVVKFDDDKLYINDGHHRVLAIYLGNFFK